MTKSELWSHAFNAYDQCLQALLDGEYSKAKELAGQAWNDFFELQKQRDQDEDFTEQICLARTIYQEAEVALAQAAAPNPEAEDEAEGTPLAKHKVYRHIRRLEVVAAGGNHSVCLEIAFWYLDPYNWHLQEQAKINFPDRAAKQLHTLLADKLIDQTTRTMAAYITAELYSRPLYELVDIDLALKMASYAASNCIGDVGISDEDKSTIMTLAMELALARDDRDLAENIVADGLQAGFDEGFAYPLWRYYFLHNHTDAALLEERMYAARTWQGMLARGQHLYQNWLNDEGDGHDAPLWQYVIDELSPFADDSDNFIGAATCRSLALSSFFMFTGPKFFEDRALVDLFLDCADLLNPWANFYVGNTYYVAANVLENEDCDNPRIAECRQTAVKYLGQAAALGLDNALEPYIELLRAGYGDPSKLDIYLDYARQLNIPIPE